MQLVHLRGESIRSIDQFGQHSTIERWFSPLRRSSSPWQICNCTEMHKHISDQQRTSSSVFYHCRKAGTKAHSRFHWIDVRTDGICLLWDEVTRSVQHSLCEGIRSLSWRRAVKSPSSTYFRITGRMLHCPTDFVPQKTNAVSPNIYSMKSIVRFCPDFSTMIKDRWTCSLLIWNVLVHLSTIADLSRRRTSPQTRKSTFDGRVLPKIGQLIWSARLEDGKCSWLGEKTIIVGEAANLLLVVNESRSDDSTISSNKWLSFDMKSLPSCRELCSSRSLFDTEHFPIKSAKILLGIERSSNCLKINVEEIEFKMLVDMNIENWKWSKANIFFLLISRKSLLIDEKFSLPQVFPDWKWRIFW